MNIPASTRLVKDDVEGLRLYSYDDTVAHPCDASFWKGIVTDDNGAIVARSYPWSPTVVVEDPEQLPVAAEYSPLYEATIIRFYRHNGTCMVSTHSQITIEGKKSRVGNGRPFTELIDQAIKEWPYTESADGNGWTPKSWRDLCHDGAVHVFLLIDESNQITDLHNLKETIVYQTEDGPEQDSFTGPRLLHAMTLACTPEGMVPYHSNGTIPLDDTHHLIVPSVPTISRREAMDIIDDGGAVVGRDPYRPDMTTKFFSLEYSYKLDAAGETFDVSHRWHQLMDENEALAAYYLESLPFHKKGVIQAEMDSLNQQYVMTVIKYLSENAIRRYQRMRAMMPNALAKYPLEKDERGKSTVTPVSLVDRVVRQVRDSQSGSRRQPRLDIENRLYEGVADYIISLPYATQHALHSRVRKILDGYIN